jgi:hypothetical protein
MLNTNLSATNSAVTHARMNRVCVRLPPMFGTVVPGERRSTPRSAMSTTADRTARMPNAPSGASVAVNEAENGPRLMLNQGRNNRSMTSSNAMPARIQSSRDTESNFTKPLL